MPGNAHILKKIHPEFCHLHTLASNESCPEESHQPVIQYQQKNAQRRETLDSTLPPHVEDETLEACSKKIRQRIGCLWDMNF